MDPLQIILRLSLVLLLSGLFGYNRQKAHKPIGFGTFIFVAIGSCALSMVSTEIMGENPFPLLGAIVTGIGFLGAGAMIKTGSDKIFGVTTAASIWLFAIIGLLIGLGHFVSAITIYLFAWIVLGIDALLQKHGVGSYRRKIVITTDLTISGQLLSSILSKHCYKHTLLELTIDKSDNLVIRHFLIEGSLSNLAKVPTILSEEKGIIKCLIQ
jgi:uncharacterized membrane protein YhiD involved in acid resistance